MRRFQHGRPTREAGLEQRRPKLAETAPEPFVSLQYPAPAAIVRRALAVPHAPRPAEVMAMQRTVGNRAAGAMLPRAPVQAKLMVHAPSDGDEREADRVADAVMRMPAVPRAETPEAKRSPVVVTGPAS